MTRTLWIGFGVALATLAVSGQAVTQQVPDPIRVVVSGFFGYSYAQGPIATPARCTADVDWFEGQSSRRGEFTNDVSFCLKGVLLTADAMEFTEAEDGSRVFKLDGNVTLTMPPASSP